MAFFEPFVLGELWIDPFEVRWRDQKVNLRPVEREIVLRLVQHQGTTLTWRQLALMLGFPDFTESVYGTVRCYVCRTRGRFRRIDAAFAQLDTDSHQGFRWAA